MPSAPVPSPRARLRAILSGPRCVKMASVFDPISARIAADLGCEAALVGGSLVSHAVLGAPDLILLTLTELAEQVGRCTRAADVPLVVDGDHGYGNALNVMRTVVELDRAGAGALMIEDTDLPRPYGPSGAPRLLPFDEGLGKVRAAVAARGDSDLPILGRTGAATITCVDDAIARLRAFEDAGVDGLFVPGVETREDLDRIAGAVRLPLVIGVAGAAVADPGYLADRGVRLWSGGHQVFAVAVNALHAAMKAVHAGTPSTALPGIAPADLFERLTRADAYRRDVRDFLGG